MHGLGLFMAFMRNSVQSEIEYRANTLVNLINSALMVILLIAILNAFFFRVETLGGWSLDQMLALFGVALILEGLIDCWLYPSLHRLSESVRRGDLDLVLVRPVDSQFAMSFSNLHIWKAPNIFIGFGIVLYSMNQLGTLSPINVAQFLLMLTCGIAIFYSIFLATCTLAFWLTMIEDVWIITYSLMEVGRFPVTAYPGWMRIVMTYVVPIAFISNVPAEAAAGLLTIDRQIAGFVVAALALGLSRWFWRYSLARYSSASS